MRTNIPNKPITSHAACRSRKMKEWPYWCSAVTAEALKIITAPKRHSASVTPKSQRSFSNRLGTFSHPLRRSCTRRLPLQLMHQFFEDAAAVFVVLKLIEAGACRGKE